MEISNTIKSDITQGDASNNINTTPPKIKNSITSTTSNNLKTFEKEQTYSTSYDFMGKQCGNFGILSALKELITSCKPQQKSIQSSITSDNCINISVKGGYNIKFLGKDQALTLTTPQGTTTKIWGDPHVIESDGDKWDFKNQSTFGFGDAKITIETTPYGKDKTKTLMKSVTVFCDNERVSVTNIDKDMPTYGGWGIDGKSLDTNIADGDSFSMSLSDNNKKEVWSKD